jgi:hypothetical protein
MRYSFNPESPLINIVCDLALLMTYLKGEKCVRAEAVKQGMERLRLPGEKPAVIVAGPEDSPALQDKIGTELTAGKGDQVFREVVREDAPRRVRGKFPLAGGKLLWAGGLALGVVLLGLALLFYLGEQDRTSRLHESEPGSQHNPSADETLERAWRGWRHHPKANPLFFRRGMRFKILLLRKKRPVGLRRPNRLRKPPLKAPVQKALEGKAGRLRVRQAPSCHPGRLSLSCCVKKTSPVR